MATKRDGCGLDSRHDSLNRPASKCSAHNALVKSILLEISNDRYGIRAWRNETGMAISPTGHTIRYGLVGSCDILGVCRGGRFLGIEVKTGSGRLRKEQEAFRDMIQRMGGLYILARSLEDVQKILTPEARQTP